MEGTFETSYLGRCFAGISDRELLVTGGWDGSNHFSTVEKYDVDGNMVETLPSLNTPRAYHACAVYKDEIYIAGGYTGTQRRRRMLGAG